METFRDLAITYFERPYHEGTSDYLHLSLSDLRRQDIETILGFFGPEEMRMVLCEVSMCLVLAIVIITKINMYSYIKVGPEA